MTAANHERHFEELMAWRDGELQPQDAERVRAHVAACADCQRMEIEMGEVSSRLSIWQVPEAPASLTARGHRLWGMSRPQWMQLAAVLVLMVGGVAMWQFARDRMAVRQASPMELAVGDEGELAVPGRVQQAAPTADRPPAEATVAPRALGQTAAQAIVGAPGPLLVRTARLSLVPREFDTARAEMERIVTAAGGFTGRIVVSDAQRGARSLNAMLRIPTPKLDESLAALKALGHVTSESQDGEDVTQQSVDLDARLSNARASEVRLKDILDKRTGRLSDVLEVERELSRVRGEIEGMQAQRKSLDRRITYATLTLEMQEERKAAVDLGPQPIATRLRNALVDGWNAAVTSALDLTVVVARIAPVLLVWALILTPPLWLLKRRLARD